MSFAYQGGSGLSDDTVNRIINQFPTIVKDKALAFLNSAGVGDASALERVIKEAMGSGRASGSRDTDVVNYLNNNLSNELVVLAEKVLITIGIVNYVQNDPTQQNFNLALDLGINSYLMYVYKKHNQDGSHRISENERNELNYAMTTIDKLGQSNSSGFGGVSQQNNVGSRTITLNLNTHSSGWSNGPSSNTHSASINLNNDLNAGESFSSFGGGDSWTHSTNNDGNVTTETFNTPTTNNNTKPTPSNEPTDNSAIMATVLQNTGELEMAMTKWDQLEDNNVDLIDYKDGDGDPDLSESKSKKESNPNISVFETDEDKFRIVGVKHAARITSKVRSSANQISVLSFHDGDTIDLEQSDVSELQDLQEYISDHRILPDKQGVKWEKNSYPYVVAILDKIKSDYIRNTMIEYLEDLINDTLIIKMGLRISMVDNIRDVAGIINGEIVSEIRGTWSGKESQDLIEAYVSAIYAQEKVISSHVLSLLIPEVVAGGDVLSLCDKVLVINIPMSAKDLGITPKPLQATRVTKSSSAYLWKIIETSARLDECVDSFDRICIYTNDGKYLTGYRSVFDNAAIDIFELSKKAFYLSM